MRFLQNNNNNGLGASDRAKMISDATGIFFAIRIAIKVIGIGVDARLDIFYTFQILKKVWSIKKNRDLKILGKWDKNISTLTV